MDWNAFLVSFATIWSLAHSRCYFYQDLSIGTTYYIYNPKYPNSYASWSACTWRGKSPANSVVAMTCDINIPYSRNCRNSYVAISPDGNSNRTTKFCGRSIRTLVTDNNEIYIKLSSSFGRRGGTFVCTLNAVSLNSQPSPKPVGGDCNCGWTYETRIVGGQNAVPNQYPSMVALVNKDTEEAFCGASIISERYVLTAAHCLNRLEPSGLTAVVGAYDISRSNDTVATASYDVTDFLVHPQYDSIKQQNDIAILRTATPILFSPYVGPVCLPFRYSLADFYIQTVTALGWGFRDLSGNKSDILQEVELSITSNGDCEAAIADPVWEKQICTYAPGKDSCLSDSGGPLLWKDSETVSLQLVGVISYGIGCATMKPAVNTRVTSYLDWILTTTPDAVYCMK